MAEYGVGELNPGPIGSDQEKDTLRNIYKPSLISGGEVASKPQPRVMARQGGVVGIESQRFRCTDTAGHRRVGV
ncbi:hypothetical protein Tco_0627474 [Tanacetum coccineum]|uniref:Uncharacterized protein n=1 Tax=Tanacetum coccineum TaxID=301880 RepID=A0ABQ4WML3_9ASTR